jgi:hypothetical protein
MSDIKKKLSVDRETVSGESALRAKLSLALLARVGISGDVEALHVPLHVLA